MTRKNIEPKARTKKLVPTGSYAIDVPFGINEQVDEGVVSLWLPSDDTLLQLSSYKRETQTQVAAIHRLEARLNREQLTDVRSECVNIVACPDVAAASGRDNEGIRWLYVYATWPDLTILATVSGAEAQHESFAEQWALDAVNSLRRTSASK